MAASCFSAMFFLFHVLIFNLVKVESRSSCPKEFNCGRLGNMSYPFSEFKEPFCGLAKIDCNSTLLYPKVEIDGVSYNAYKKWLWVNGIDLSDSILEGYLAKRTCKSFERNLSFANTPSVSFGVSNNITLFKCMNGGSSSNDSEEKGGYFRRYENYLNCAGFNLYYHKLRTDRSYSVLVGDDLPANCSVIRLPLKYISPTEPVPSDLFDLLTSNFTLDWEVSKDCSECLYRERQCQNDSKNNFFCSEAAKRNLGRILGTVFSCIGIVILLFRLRKKIFWHKYIRLWESKTEDHLNIEAFLKNSGSYAPKRYNYTDIKRITSHFKNKLGQGGFGNIYRGSLHNGSQVAMKVLNELKGNGEDFNEVASISKTSHVNIVSLVGFCFEGRKRALVYEFMPNGSLEKFIYQERSDGVRQLGWPMLYKIALGIARGLEYLHRGCNTRILHFDIKPHNILLDEDFCPKISDFGLANLCMKKESIVSMLGPRGTIGYIAPEIVCRNLGGVSHKSDVYSYGMMVLEMVGGRKNVDVEVDHTSEIYFPHWLYQRIELDEELQLIGIMNEEENECARKMVIASLWCIQTDPSNRPSMSKVVEMLEGKVDSLQMPPKPYLYSPSRTELTFSSTMAASSSSLQFTATTFKQFRSAQLPKHGTKWATIRCSAASPSKSYKITLLPGDGIGPEVISVAKNALQLVASIEGFEVAFEEMPMGGAALDAVGVPLPDETLKSAKKSDATLLGAIGGYKWDSNEKHLKPETGLLQLREGLQVFANLRPATVLPQLVDASTLKKEVAEGVDLMVVRELTGGIYFGKPRGFSTNENGQEIGFNTEVYAAYEIDRIARIAFETARKRRGKLCSVDKANVLEASMLWRKRVTALASEYPDVELSHMYVDNAAMQLVRNPKQFDTIVTNNIFGDILSDEASMITGSIGMLPSASLGATGPGLFEPIHGSAPDIAGQDKANPLATMLSAAMLLKYGLGEEKAAQRIEAAVLDTLNRGFRTGDIHSAGHKLVGCKEMGEEVFKSIDRKTPAAV